MKYIGLLDCNNFFVSCERLFRPDLLGRPVVVLSSNDGCVVARSNEVKELGIPMGVPVFKVKDEFKKHEVVSFSSNFPLYRDISARVMNVLRGEVERMEQYSVDEAFFSVSDKEDIDMFMKELKQVVEQKVGVPVSIGVAKTKTLAKVASSIAKKVSGTHFLSGDEWGNMAKDMQIGELWGVGGGLSLRYRNADITTPFGLMEADTARIAKLFGVSGTRLQSELRGVPAYSLERKRTLQESIMSSRSFRTVEHNITALEKAVAYHVDHAVASLREMNGLTGTLYVRVSASRFSDFALQGVAGEVQLLEPTDDPQVLLGAALRVLRKQFKSEVPYKKAGIVLGAISPKEQATGNLFVDPKQKENNVLWETVSDLRSKFGKDIVSLYGATGGSTLTSKVHSSGSQTTDWRDIPTIKAI